MQNRILDEGFNEEEVEKRRDEVIRQMANTPPQPRIKIQSFHPKKQKSTASGRLASDACNKGF